MFPSIRQFIFTAFLLVGGFFIIHPASAAINKSTSQDALSNGLVGWWTFDGADVNATRVLDKSGQGKHLSRDNGVSTGIGKIGQAAYFDGVNDILSSVQNGTFTFPITISAWVNQKDRADIRTIIRMGWQDVSPPFLWMFVLPGGSIRVSYTTGLGLTTLSSSGIITTNKWRLVTFTIDSANVGRFYINGVLDASSQLTTPTSPSSVDYSIGAYHSGAYRMFGKLDDVGVYNRALSLAEIQQLYAMGK